LGQDQPVEAPHHGQDHRDQPASVQRIWRAHDLQPRRIRTFKRSRDPDFAAKLEDIVGLARHRRFVFYYTLTSGSWLNAVETLFPALIQRRLKRGSFQSVVDLQARDPPVHRRAQRRPQAFTWTKTPGQILAKLNPPNAPVH
jgi:hypothetical protein